jgi:hypothetical protein
MENPMRKLVLLLVLATFPRWLSAQASNPIPVDALIDMNGSPVGTPATPAIMRAGTQGFPGVNWQINDSVAALKVGPQRFNLPGPVKIGSTVYQTNYPHQSLAYDTSYSFNDFRAFFPDNNLRAVTTAGFITVGIPDQGGSGGLSDLVRISGPNGAFAVMQLYNGHGPGYVLNIESDGNDTIHSSKIAVTPGGTYWYCLKADYGAGRAYLNVYGTPNFNLIGSTTLNIKTGSGLEYIQYGNGEDAQSSGRGINFNYFELSLIDWTNAVFPLLPSGSVPPNPPTNLTILVQ